jgi:uncharacterized membrane protein
VEEAANEDDGVVSSTLGRRSGRSGSVGWLFGLSVALIFGAIVRISLARYSLWSDELASVFFARQPLTNLWSWWMVRETNPPLYYSFLHGWIDVVGLGTVRLRLLSIAAGLVAIVVTYLGVSKYFGKRAGLIAALMLALSAQQLHFSLMVRSYIFLYLAISVSFFGLLGVVRTLDNPGRKLLLAWAAYVFGAIAGVYLHTTACIWPIAATISLIAVDRRYLPLVGSRWLHLVFADALIVAGSSWWLYITYLQLRVPNGNISWIAWPGLRETASYFFSTVLLSRDTTGWAKIIPLAIAGFSLLCVVRTWKQPRTRLALACPVVAVLLFTLLSLKQPVIMDKTILWVSIFPLTLAAAGLATIRNSRVFAMSTFAVLLLLGINLARSSRDLRIENWTDAVRTIAKDPRGVLLVDGESMGVNANMACTIDLGTRGCPFPVLTFQRTDDAFDPWAFGYAEKADVSSMGRIALPGDANVYLFRRASHDVLATMHQVGLLEAVDATQPSFLGPYKPPLVESMIARVQVRNGLLRVGP